MISALFILKNCNVRRIVFVEYIKQKSELIAFAFILALFCSP